ncbi:nuclear exosome regulator NRDE2 [Drosophila rhopaloa]|uniref:Protein NRDE2 homolog n=1 Tax=Drosophila rhopaloa TaxID=1041015 RepID=A0A6P4EAD6_DRORH|nr:nuclear exosome regulator NRDE2 [Drosophila rhopaloa]
MSLFPAYGGGQSPAFSVAKEIKNPEKDKEAGTKSANWKNNESYNQKHIAVDHINIPTQSPTSDSSTDSEDSSAEASEIPIKAKDAVKAKLLEFDANDEFYVDKNSNSMYRSLSTLTKPTRPRYKSRMTRLRDLEDKTRRESGRSKLSSKSSRYTGRNYVDCEATPSTEEVRRLQEQLIQSKVLVQREPQRVEHWLELHRLLDLNLDKANRLAVAEHQLHTLETALEHHPSNEQILRLYTDVANATYQASEVAARFTKMLDKNPFEYTLWTALIMVTQGNMARCNVPAVLRIYAFSMRRMHVGHTDEHSRELATVDTDRIMLKLFHNCVLFMRQTGSLNMMFALLRLTLELNFPGLSVDCFEACAASEKPLIEYEEMVLRSGMPMPEIWSRVERLRQAHCYLPYPQLTHSEKDAVAGGLDTQRCIFSDDVVAYAHALKSPDNRLHLLLLVVQLTKMPFVRSACLAAKLNPRIDEFGESEAIEMLFASLADRHSYAVPLSRNAGFNAAMLDLAKDICVTPSFMPHLIGYELYAATISSLLLKCSEAFRSEESKRMVFLVLWMRFQRLLVVLHKLTGKLTKSYRKETRLRIRKQLALPENRRVLRFYTELAMCEFEGLEKDDDENRVFDLFKNIITTGSQMDSDFTSPDLMHSYLVCAEMLIKCCRRDEAVHLLSCLCMCQHADSLTTEAATAGIETSLKRGLHLLQEEVATLDTLPAEMPLEEYFLPNKLLILLRARCLLLMLDLNHSVVDRILDELLQHQLGPEAVKNSERRRFLREQVMEIQILQLQLPHSPPGEVDQNLRETAKKGNTGGKRTSLMSRSAQLVDLVSRGLDEFPRNLMMLQCWAGFNTMLWHKQRARFIRAQAGIISLVHLVIAARCRFAMASDRETLPGTLEDHVQLAVRNRLVSMFETFLPTNKNRSEIEEGQYRLLRRNSLYWRMYLQCLSDTRTSFERSKECLLTAMDECPWDKALLMEGTKFVPQDMPHLQDVMTEKELRIYALPEELDILRES